MSLTGRASDIDPIDHYGYTILHYANGEATLVYMRPPRPKDPLVSMGGLFGGKEDSPSLLGYSHKTEKGGRLGTTLHETTQRGIPNQARLENDPESECPMVTHTSR